jgi:hypothetical protein
MSCWSDPTALDRAVQSIPAPHENGLAVPIPAVKYSLEVDVCCSVNRSPFGKAVVDDLKPPPQNRLVGSSELDWAVHRRIHPHQAISQQVESRSWKEVG